MRLALALTLLASPALADVEEALEGHVFPGLDGFAAATAALSAAAEQDCTAATLRAPAQAAWDAWAPVADLRLGPSEPAALSIAYWPDERGAGAKALRGLIAAEDPAGLDPAAYAEVSAAARGFPALDLLLGDPELSAYAEGSYTCALVRSVAADLAAQAHALEAAWPAEAEALATAGAQGNARYLSPEEAAAALYAQAFDGLEFTADSRLGRPLGEPDRPRPTRAAFWRSARPLPDALASAEAAARLVTLLADAPLPATEAALEGVRRAEGSIEDPSFQDIGDPTARLEVEILQQRLRALRDAIEAEVGTPLGLRPGFKSRDGD